MKVDPDDIEESDVVPCRYCKAPVYWGPFYDKAGEMHRRLFNVVNRRPHGCGQSIDPNAFAAVPE